MFKIVFVFHKSKTISGQPPSELMDKMRWLENYPNSSRLAKELFEAGKAVLKSNHMILPFVSTIAFLQYRQGSENIWLSYKRHFMGEDSLEVCVEGPIETKQCVVYRERGYDLYKDLDRDPESAVDRCGGVFGYMMALERLNPSSVNWIKFSIGGKVHNTEYRL